MLPDKQQAKAVPARPKRRATNAHIFRYLQHGNPNRLQDRDLKRALEASLEESSEVWPAEDTASCSSSDQSNAPSASGSTGLAHQSPRQQTAGIRLAGPIRNDSRRSSQSSGDRRDTRRADHQSTECTCSARPGPTSSTSLASSSSSTTYMQQCPVHVHKRPKVHKRYKPVVKKNIYYEADFFHEGIMEYISYELVKFSKLG